MKDFDIFIVNSHFKIKYLEHRYFSYKIHVLVHFIIDI